MRGVIAVADTLRSSAKGAVQALQSEGIVRIVVLTGDNQRVADAICADLGVDEVYADLLPEEKLRIIEGLKGDGPVTMVGDGVNDAPALATASIGVAMGGAGTDVALETADVVLMADDLSKLPYAIDLSRRTRRTIRQNLSFSLGRDRHRWSRDADPRHSSAARRGWPRGEHGDRRAQWAAVVARPRAVEREAGNGSSGRDRQDPGNGLMIAFDLLVALLLEQAPLWARLATRLSPKNSPL